MLHVVCKLHGIESQLALLCCLFYDLRSRSLSKQTRFYTLLAQLACIWMFCVVLLHISHRPLYHNPYDSVEYHSTILVPTSTYFFAKCVSESHSISDSPATPETRPRSHFARIINFCNEFTPAECATLR